MLKLRIVRTLNNNKGCLMWVFTEQSKVEKIAELTLQKRIYEANIDNGQSLRLI